MAARRSSTLAAASPVAQWAERHFELSRHGTTLRTEVNAGVAAFLATAYVLLVNGQILSSAGMLVNDAVIGTAVGSVVATLTAAVFGNLPVVLAPGMALNAYLAYGLINGPSGLDRAAALGCCFWTGIALAVLAIARVRDTLVSLIPSSVKRGSVIGMGLLISLIGMKSVSLVVHNPLTVVELGNIADTDVWLTLIGRSRCVLSIRIKHLSHPN